MSEVAILSDIHSNRQALDAVLDDVARLGIGEWWCVGDVVGYGADPAYAVDVCRAQAARCIAGNHDLGVAGRIPLEDFAAWALDAVVWTRRILDDASRTALGDMLPTDTGHEIPLVHASLRDPVWEYVVSPAEATASLELTHAHMTCIGHTHVPAAWHRADDGTVTEVPTTNGVALTPGRWLINPGSVGQPRDGDPRASWARFHPESGTITFMRTPYDVAAAQRAIRAAGLPEILAERLAEGY